MGGSHSHEAISYNTPLQGTKQKGFSHIYRCSKFMKELRSTPAPNIKSVKDIIYQSWERYKNKDFLGKITLKPGQNGASDERQLTKFTYDEIFKMAEKVGSYLINNRMQFVEPIHNMKLIGIYSKNRYEWVVADVACMLYGLTVVPLYQTLGIDNLTYCLQHSGIKTLFVTAGTIKTVLGLKGHGNLQKLISLDTIPSQVQKQLINHKFKVYHFDQALKNDKIINHKQVEVTGKNCLTFSYTSGTTGPPKGAMISHSNFLALVTGLNTHQINGFHSDDSYVSFLPLPHMMERAVVVGMIYGGSFIAFYNGDVAKVKDDCAFIKPTIFIAVPRLYNRIVESVQKTFSQAQGIKGCLIKSGMQSKMSQVHESGDYQSAIYDSLIFHNVKDKFGGRIRLMITGSAPIKKQVYQCMKVYMSCPFYQGYGQTQNTAAAFVNYARDPLTGHVGAVMSTMQFKLNDAQQMHYTSQDKDDQGRPSPRGEIWIRGPPIFMGYYKDVEKTNQTITPDGWLKTGDIGQILPGSNAMKVIDRRKNIFKLQQGQYIAPQKVQAVYSKSHLTSQIFLHGESNHNYAVAIIVPNKQQLLKLAQKHSIKGGYEQLCKNKDIKILMLKQLDSIGKQNGLMSFEQAKSVYLQPQSFIAKGLVSSTMKLQRFAAKKYYAKQIQAMYSQQPANLK